MRKIVTVLFLLAVLLANVTGCHKKPQELNTDPVISDSVINNPAIDDPGTDANPKPTNQTEGNKDSRGEFKAPELTWIKNLQIPEYEDEAYVAVNDNMPFFDLESLEPTSYEIYYDLDELGRCTLADAVVGPETMSTGERGNISSVKPTGWHSDKYSFVNGQALYNRCHLIAHYISDENANKYNLVTGTRYMNEDGMNALENLIGDYMKETQNHVRYRVTPIWTGENLICDGLLVEAYSIEDEGDGVCFNIYAYNVQPGVYIDYRTGDNHAIEGYEDKIQENKTEDSKEANIPSYLLEEDYEATFVLNVKKMKFHREDCPGVADISDKNKGTYTGSRNELVKQGYVPCSGCNP